MPSSIAGSIERERREVANLFTEDVELELSSLCHTYCEFRVSKVDGRKPNAKVVVCWYDTDIYLDPKDRRAKALKVFIWNDPTERYCAWSYTKRMSHGTTSLEKLLVWAHFKKEPVARWSGTLSREMEKDCYDAWTRCEAKARKELGLA